MPEDQEPKKYSGISNLKRAPKKSSTKNIILIVAVIAGASIGGVLLHKHFVEKPSAEAVTEDKTEPTTPAINEEVEITSLDFDIDQDDSTTTPAISSEATTDSEWEEASKPITSEEEETKSISEVTTEPTEAEAAKIASGDLLGAIQEGDRLTAARKFSESNKVLETVVSSGNKESAKDSNLISAALYRMGLNSRHLKDEKSAQKYWQEAYKNYPETVTGRLSAIALADTWYYWYVTLKKNHAKWEEIRNAYSTAIGMDGARFLDAKTEAKVAGRLNILNDYLVFNPTTKTEGAIFHTVEPGEYLSTIARIYKLDDWTSITNINKISPNKIRPGMELKILNGRSFILVDKKNFTLSWYLDGRFIKRYRCATGKKSAETPAGRYVVSKIEKEPEWTDPETGKRYQYGQKGHKIGSRWIALEGGNKNGLGIHGTIFPESMGTKASLGCVRLLNGDVEQLYGFVRRNDTEVLIIE